ncbi:MAG: hypothetical protein PHG06_22455 [Parabacteroides sp.]|nr:hypothetical protein [Parabacteroides sp.]
MKDDAFKKIESVLYLPDSEAAEQLTPFENERRKRWVYCIQQKMEDPLKPDKTLVDELTTGFSGIYSPVSKTTAYRDIAAVQKIIGNIQLAAKNWYRYMIIEGAKKAYQIAEENGDGKGMAAALDKIGKYTMADKPDNDFDWEQMIPLDIEPAADPDLLENVQKIDNLEQRRRELRALWKGDLQSEAIDITPEE